MTSPVEDASLIRWLDEVTEADRRSVGTKAVRLGLLRRAGFRVPDGFCVTVEGYQYCMGLSGLERWWQSPKDTRDKLREAFKERGLPEYLEVQIAAAYQDLIDRLPGKKTVAVRSSAVLEDAAYSSFSGLYCSVLSVDGLDQTLEAIKQCWLSVLSDEVLAYLQRFGHAPETNGMAVLIQEMIEGEISGVTFTANPTTGNPFELCFSAAPGICEPVVSGRAVSALVTINREDDSRIQPQQGESLVSGDRLKELLAVADGVEESFGGSPQDIEWSFSGKECYVLQTRPITALPPYFPLGEQEKQGDRVWKLTFMGMFSPFGCSLERIKNKVYFDALYRQTGKRKISRQRVINGYLYDCVETPFVSRLSPVRAYKFLAHVAYAKKLYAKFREEVVPRYLHAIESCERMVQEAGGLEQLIGCLDAVVHEYLQFQKDSLAAVGLANLFPKLLKRFCRVSGATDSDLDVLSLILGEHNETLRRDEIFDSLCQELQETGLRDILMRASSLREARGTLAQTRSGQSFLNRWDAFYREYNYTWACGNPKDPGWEEDLSIVLASLRRALEYRDESLSGKLAKRKQERARNERELTDRLGRLGRVVFGWLLERARRYYPVRENRNHLFYRGVAAMRVVLRTIGADLKQRGLLDVADDVFYLTYDELKELGMAPGSMNVKEHIDKRKQDYKRYRRLQPPRILGGSGPQRVAKSTTRGKYLTGQACSAGTVRGRARIVHTPRELSRLGRGEILVVRRVRPYFTTFLGIAAGLVTEEGSALSHGANIAREYGIPAVLGAEGVTDTVKDGDLLTVDGSRGVVTIESRSDAFPYFRSR